MEVFAEICPDVDLLVSRLNNILDKIVSRTRDPMALAVDVLVTP